MLQLQSHSVTKPWLIIIRTLKGGVIFGRNTPSQWLWEGNVGWRTLVPTVSSHPLLSPSATNLHPDTHVTLFTLRGSATYRQVQAHLHGIPLWGSSSRGGGPQGQQGPLPDSTHLLPSLCWLASAYILSLLPDDSSHLFVYSLIYITQIALTSLQGNVLKVLQKLAH